MEINTFAELQAQMQALFQQKEYAAALELAGQQMERFPEQAHLLNYWRFAMAAQLGDAEQALAVLRQVLDGGFWYGDTLLRQSRFLKSLQGLPEFEDLVSRNHELEVKDPTLAYPLLIVRSQGRCQAGGPPCPLLIGLHANGSTAQASVDFWRPAASAGWLVAVPQSTQALWKGAYIWDDRQQAANEIKKHLASLSEQYAVDPQQVVLAGHDLGGELAIWMALTGATPVRGFIAINPDGPWMRDPDGWLPLIQDHAPEGLRGYIVFGEEDESLDQENLEMLAEVLTANGVECELEKVALAGHDYAPEFESSLVRALAMIS